MLQICLSSTIVLLRSLMQVTCISFTRCTQLHHMILNSNVVHLNLGAVLFKPAKHHCRRGGPLVREAVPICVMMPLAT